MEMTLTTEEKKILLSIARERIRSELENTKTDFPEPTETLSTVCGAFVTLHKEGELRGCIGNIVGSKPLYKEVYELAASSAFRDPRFPPLGKDEYSHIDIEISVLTPLTKVADPEEIEVGTHGIMIKSGPHSGVLLPQVPVEQGWNREQFLDNTCRKAGLPAGCRRDENTEIYIFSALVFGESEFAEGDR